MLTRLAALCVAFLLSMYFRSYFGVVGPALANDLSLSPQEFGWLASAFFASFSILQIPCGLAFDRWGVRWPMVTMMSAGAAGSALVAVSSNFWTAILGQVLIGIGCAPIFMGVLYYLGKAHSAETAARLAAIVSAVGSAGALVSALPLSSFTDSFGWRSACWLAGAAVLGGAISIALTMESLPSDKPAPKGRTGISAFLPLLYLMPICFTLSLGGTFRNAWATPYVTAMFAKGSDIGVVLTIVSIVGVATSFILPALLVRVRASAIVVVTFALGCFCAMTLAAFPDLSMILVCVGLSILYAMGNVHPLVMTEAQTLIPEHTRGIALGALNSLVFLGVSAASSVFGQIAGLSLAPGTTYRIIFVATAAALATAVLVYVVFRDRRDASPHESAEESQAIADMD